ncbi:aspartyl-phosphate phosphatase Spo0E family protein [Bacillus tianshenii]|nr:aspartyl-phosphate phosphatase Spo0E family protein [Bacillus tianshenii]
MCANESKLLNEIEECRNKMHKLSTTHSLNSEAVILISKELDKLLNDYEELKYTKVVSV